MPTCGGPVARASGAMGTCAAATSKSRPRVHVRTCRRSARNGTRWKRTRTCASHEPVVHDEGRGGRDARSRAEQVRADHGGERDVDGRAWLRLGSWVGAACAFGAGVCATLGPRAGQAYFAGYVLEQSLSVDNLFVFVLIFQYFRVPLVHQKKILDYGIASAAVLRLVVIALGTELLQRFEPLLLGFAVVLLYSAYGILVAKQDDVQDGDLSRNAVVQGCRKLFRVTDQYDEGRFFTVGADGLRRATPLLVALITVEISDVVFAVDSIPAVFGVTRDPFLVYTSNLFAIASLRTLYAYVANAVEELRYLQTSVGWILAFVGVKIVVEYAGVDVPTELSLAVVLVLLAAGVVASLLVSDPSPPTTTSTKHVDTKPPPPSPPPREQQQQQQERRASRRGDGTDESKVRR